MKRLSILAALILANSAATAQEMKARDSIVTLECPDGQTCTLKCGTLEHSYKTLEVFQYSGLSNRLWLRSDTKRFVVGAEQTCSFEGNVRVDNSLAKVFSR